MKKKRNNSKKPDLPLPDPTSRSFYYDEADDFNDRDDHYIINDSDDGGVQEQVLGLVDSDEDMEIGNDEESADDEEESEDDDQSGDDDDDDLQMEEDFYSDEKDDDHKTKDVLGRLGKLKSNFFGTDLPDERLHNALQPKAKYQTYKKDRGLELEMEGAKVTQERMKNEMSQWLFSNQLFSDIPDQGKEELPNKIEAIELNDKKASRKKNVTLPLLKEFQETLDELSNLLSPLIKAKKKGLLPLNNVTEYLQTRYLLCLNYLNVVSVYMLLKSDGEVSGHPVETRLAQYKHLFKELKPCKQRYDNELWGLLSDLKSGKLKAPRKLLGVIQKGEVKKKVATKSRSGKDEPHLSEGPPGAKDKLEQPESIGTEEENQAIETKVLENGLGDEEMRRTATWEMMKNKGLLPYRKKEQRNPRVYYKSKFQRKLKIRKFQVPKMRQELERYGGEPCGINDKVIKSVKFK